MPRETGRAYCSLDMASASLPGLLLFRGFDMNQKNFEKAFNNHMGSCWATCVCGREFYNHPGGWDWEDGELEKLENDPKATNLDWSVGFVEFEGCLYVVDCDCWEERAKLVMGFIDSHAHQIAEYLALEKQRKLKDAEAMPTPVRIDSMSQLVFDPQ